MRKQTKLVAVLSAAALLAIGASMTSFAAGWQKNDDGTWSYYDSDDEMVAGEWKKDGAKWFYLDDDGIMLTDSWVDDEYYVNESGAMIVNDWKKTVADEDIEDPEDDGEGWYYFDSKGKKVTTSKKVAGKTYYFNSDGKMEDGWFADDNNTYYLGGEDDGARKSGWLWLEKPETDDTVSTGCDDDCDACDEEGWYYFGSDGKMYQDAKKKKVNGKYYFFNEHGQMLYEWINGAQVDVGSNAQLDGSNPGGATIGEMIYTNVVEEGWRADGWYEIDGSEDVGTNNDTDWYYFKDGEAKKAVASDKNGLKDDTSDVFRARIKVEGKYFCFDQKGRMKTGLQFIGNDMYYFDTNGYMKTGKIASVEEENDSYSYYFITKQGDNGKGYTGEKDGYLYWKGKRLEAQDDYAVYKVDGKFYLVNNKGKCQKSTSKGYDVENTGATDLKFTFKDKSYEIKDMESQTDKAYTAEIELIDSKIVSNGNKATSSDKGYSIVAN